MDHKTTRWTEKVAKLGESMRSGGAPLRDDETVALGNVEPEHGALLPVRPRSAPLLEPLQLAWSMRTLRLAWSMRTLRLAGRRGAVAPVAGPL